MKSMRKLLLKGTIAAAGLLVCFAGTSSQAMASTFEQVKPPKIAVVNFKTCVEKSKIGSKEQAGFDAMKKQMESVLEEKEKALTEISSKLNDIDYLDSLSPDAETELKRKFRNLNQEYSQQQNQFYQVLSQTNLKVVQKLTDAITKASQEVAKKNQIDLVLNEDSAFYNVPSLDISQLVIQALDEAFEKESKDKDSNKPATIVK